MNAFACTAHNEKIKAIYGNYCFWSWFRYWYLDSADLITLMLMDKGYYDYDYEKPSARVEAAMSAVKSDAELVEKLKQSGFTLKKKVVSAEALQTEVMAERSAGSAS